MSVFASMYGAMSTLRQRVAEVLRTTRLLTPVDRLRLVVALVASRRENRRFLAGHPDFPVPPPALAFDAYHHVRWREYHDSGMAHARLVADLVRQHVAGNPLRICEWGCGPGRVIRHLRTALGDRGVELFAADANAASIAWCREHLPDIDFRPNQQDPPLPFQAEAFDVLYAISVFTHLSARSHEQWMAEIFRVLRPGGVVLFTTHGDACADRLLPGELKRYRAGELVVRGQVREGSKCFVAYHPPNYVREKLLADAQVLVHLPSPAAYQMSQDVWVATKKT